MIAGKEQTIKVKQEDDGQRLDRWLKKYVPELPYVLAQKLIRKGAVKIDGTKARMDSRIAAGQDIRIPAFEMRGAAGGEKPPYRISADDEKMIRAMVLYDDGDVIALNKPAGLATQGGGDEKRHIDGMLPVLAGKDGTVPRLVHRLDKETSGVLLLARSAEAVRRLGKSFKERNIRKIYWAVTLGVPAQREGTIRAPVGKVKGPIKDKMTIDEIDGKGAVTDFVVIDRMQSALAFVAFWPRTGRTHQIRVHAAEILECPVLGDRRYGGQSDEFDALDLAPRLYLHARRVILPHPLDEMKMLDITAPLDVDLAGSWETLGFDSRLKDDPFETL